jgi:hypothetical protein
MVTCQKTNNWSIENGGLWPWFTMASFPRMWRGRATGQNLVSPIHMGKLRSQVPQKVEGQT